MGDDELNLQSDLARLHLREAASFLSDAKVAGTFNTQSAFLSLETSLEALSSDRIQKPRTKKDKFTALVAEHETIHFLQHCGTIYGVSGVVAHLRVKRHLLSALVNYLDKGKPLPLPLWDWTMVPEGLPGIPSCPEPLRSALLLHRHDGFFRMIHNGGFFKKLVSRDGAGLGDIVAKRFGPMRFGSIPYIFDTHLHSAIRDWVSVFDKPAASNVRGFVADKIFVLHGQTPQGTHSGLFLGAHAIEEAWATLVMEASDTMFSLLYTGGKDYLNPFDEYHALARADKDYEVYTACTNLCTEILGEEHYYPLIPFLVRLYDFCLMNSSLLDEQGAYNSHPDRTPDALLFRAVSAAAETGQDLKFAGDRFNELSRGIVFDDIFSHIEQKLGLPSAATTIRTFLQRTLDPLLDEISELNHPALEEDLKYLSLCKRALELRLEQPYVFCNPMSMEARAPVREFVATALAKGLFMRDRQRFGGDSEGIRRWISDDVLNQIVFGTTLHCPFVRHAVPCPDRVHECDRELPELVAAFRGTQHRCMLSDFIGRTGLIDIQYVSENRLP